MNCNDVDRLLIEATMASRSSQAEDHLKGCKRCQDLVRALTPSVGPDSPSSANLRQIELGIFADFRPVRPMIPARYLFAALAGIFISFVAVGVYRMGAFAIAVMSPVQAGVVLGMLAIGAGLLAYSLALQMVPGSLHRIPPELLPVGIMISLTIAMGVLFQFQHERHFWANGRSCLRAGIPISVLAAVPFWLVLRRGAILSPSWTGAATGLLAGLVGTSVLEIHCPNLDAWHILVSHLGVSVLCTIAGLGIGLAFEIAGSRSVGRGTK